MIAPAASPAPRHDPCNHIIRALAPSDTDQVLPVGKPYPSPRIFVVQDVKIPVVAYYEAKRGLLATGATTKLDRFLNFAQKLGIVNTTIGTYDVASQIYADLRKEGKLIEDADIFIGAASLENGAILVTNNPSHLSRIKNIQLEVWN